MKKLLGPSLISEVTFLFFGAKHLQEIVKGFGKGIREFKKGLSSINNFTKIKEE